MAGKGCGKRLAHFCHRARICRGEAVADFLKPLGIGATANAVVKRFEGDALLGQLALDIFVAVKA